MQHEMRYDHKSKNLVAFESQDALEKAKGVCKKQQRAAHKRRTDKDRTGSGPSRGESPFGSHIGGRPIRGGQMPAGCNLDDPRIQVRVMNLAILHFAKKMGVNFAIEPESKPEPQPNLGRARCLCERDGHKQDRRMSQQVVQWFRPVF